ncbi:hypothetical protein M404DRAFT_999152 [Pisolithus tinctorius Marx 270]|uniref:Uncharacterized protein n=1 Tax=Pisolithus tinctorius Marx 270 TaxID=870435 RepID=A0A0C3KA66_PISTI|nr:hypothetical protein M404DRAFT_999152 [Pisolithus tinctorius Marx 270]
MCLPQYVRSFHTKTGYNGCFHRHLINVLFSTCSYNTCRTLPELMPVVMIYINHYLDPPLTQSSLALASLGYDVLATDTAYVCDSVLRNNIRTNLPHLHSTRVGTVQVRALDWLVSSDMWNWDDPLSITPATQSNEGPKASGVEETLRPPFDLIVSSDTLYDESLIDPLFATLQALCNQGRDTTSSLPNKPPVILIALERRDPALISTALARAPVPLVQVPTKKLKKALDRSDIQWDGADWDGVEIWRGVGRL